MSNAMSQLIALRANTDLLLSVSHDEAVKMFKPLVREVGPSFEKVLTDLAFSEGAIRCGEVACFYDGAVIDSYLKYIGADWCSADMAEMSAFVQVLVEDNDMYYYSDCKQDFSVVQAAELAAKAGKSKVMMENLS